MEPVSIQPHSAIDSQIVTLGKSTWSVARLLFLARDLPVYEVPVIALNVYQMYEVTMRELVGHMKAVLGADLEYPIILDQDGEVMDGRHRIMKAILEGKPTIKIKRFQNNPCPCLRKDLGGA